MKIRNVVFAAALVAVTAGVTTTVVSQEGKEPPMPEMTPEQQAMMEKWMAYATPGEQHAILAKKVGKWNIVVKMWEAPDQTPGESTGSSEFKMAMDGRYLMDHTKGDTPMGPFEGIGCTGFDNLKQKYVTTWIDSMSTGIMYAEGTFDAAAKTFTFHGEMPDPMAGKYVKVRSTEKWIDDNQWVMASFTKGKDGKEFKGMEITYTRAK
jgi:hypothetical protein